MGLSDRVVHPGSINIFCEKKGGSHRMYIDYQELNKLSVKNRYLLPRIEGLFDHLHDSSWFSKIDLCSGYHQMRFKVENMQKTVFKTCYGQYEFVVMLFGVTNAQATFMDLMNRMFKLMRYWSVIIFIDDIVVYSKTKEHQEDHM